MSQPASSVGLARPRKILLPQINLIRAVAMLGVYIHHLGMGVPGFFDVRWLYAAFGPFVEIGDQGVGLFNIVTGFVLAWPHLGPEARPALSYQDFLRKRFLRIVPAYYISLVAAVIPTALYYGKTASWTAWNVGERLLFLQSWDYEAMMSNIAAYWWLGLLAQFYLTFPLILRFFQRVGPVRAALTALVVCWGWVAFLTLAARVVDAAMPGGVLSRALGWAQYLSYFNLPGRLAEFCLGMWLASAWTGWREPEEGAKGRAWPFSRAMTVAGGVALAVFAVGLIPKKLELPFVLYFNSARCLLVILLVFALPALGRLGANRLVAGLAAASYSIYLVHQPILGFAHEFAAGWMTPTGEFLFKLALVSPVVYAAAKLVDAAAEKASGGVEALFAPGLPAPSQALAFLRRP